MHWEKSHRKQNSNSRKRASHEGTIRPRRKIIPVRKKETHEGPKVTVRK